MDEFPRMRLSKTRQAYEDYLAFGGDLEKLMLSYGYQPNPPVKRLRGLMRMAKENHWEERAKAYQIVPKPLILESDVYESQLASATDLSQPRDRIIHLAELFMRLEALLFGFIKNAKTTDDSRWVPPIIGQLRGLLGDIGRETRLEQLIEQIGISEALGRDGLNLAMLTPTVLADKKVFSDEELIRLHSMLTKAAAYPLLKEGNPAEERQAGPVPSSEHQP